ncbi:MAG: hypothetical protein M3Y77_07615 [Actinomycetota bacterium]|nr:hypothetical protein [Actinomycetota bacterium]
MALITLVGLTISVPLAAVRYSQDRTASVAGCPAGEAFFEGRCLHSGVNAVRQKGGLTSTSPKTAAVQLKIVAELNKHRISVARESSRSGQVSAGSGQANRSEDVKGGGQDIVDPCYYKADNSGTSSAMKGHTRDQGFAVTRYCPADIAIKITNNFKKRVIYQAGNQTFVPYNPPAPGQPPPAAPVAPPPPSPEEVAQIAIANLPVPAPTLNMGPGRESAVVHQPLWLWVDDPGPITATANLVGVQVTAIAKLTKTTWNMGETVGKPGSGKNQRQAVVECPGAGTPAPAPQDLPDSPADWKPACGYSYQWRSTIARTGSQSCQWPVTAVTQWTVTWTSNLGVGGTTVLETRNTTGINIAELRTVLVDDPNAQVATPAKPGCY